MSETIFAKSPSPNLMRWIFIGSLLVHLALLFYAAAIYRSQDISVIELSMIRTEKPVGRAIPRPKTFSTPPKVSQANPVVMSKPIALPTEVDHRDTQAVNLPLDTVTAPRLGGIVSGISNDMTGTATEFFSKADYVDGLRYKIERFKKYPDDARKKSIEGRVVVQFVITQDGQLSSLKIVKQSRYEALNQAALNAVSEAAPFSPPPSTLFTTPLCLKLTIVFEIT